MTTLFNLSMLAAMGFGMFFPLDASWKWLTSLFLGTLLFFNFLRIDFSWSKFVRKEVAWALLSWMLAMPAIGWLCGLGLPDSQALGVLLTAVTPTAIGSVVIISLLGGTLELGIAIVALLNLLAPFVYPMVLGLANRTSEVSVPLGRVLGDVSLLVFGPLALSLVARLLALDPLRRLTPYANFCLVGVIYMAVATTSEHLGSLSTSDLSGLFFRVLVLAGAGFAGGWFLSRDGADRKTLSIAMGQRNTGLGCWVALSFFPADTVLAPVLYTLVQHTTTTLLVMRAQGSRARYR